MTTGPHSGVGRATDQAAHAVPGERARASHSVSHVTQPAASSAVTDRSGRIARPQRPAAPAGPSV
eukprot:2806928-Pyramimonas_sp.AAC.1